MPNRLLVFDMDGVLVDVTESLSRDHRADRGALHRHDASRASRFRTTRTRAAGTTTGRSRTTSSTDVGVEVAYETVVDYFQSHLPRQRRATA